MPRLRVGVQLSPQHTTYTAYAQAVRQVEELGVDTIWNWHTFFMNSVEDDCRYAYNCRMDEDHPPWTCDAVLGEIGLSKGHKFMYYFDYGDQHRFDVEVVETWPASAVTVRATYPQIIGGQGEAPEQEPHS